MASFLHLCNRCSAVVRFPTEERPEKIYCNACKEAMPGDGVFQTEQLAAEVAEKNKALGEKRAATDKAQALAKRVTEKADRSNAARLKEQKEAAAKPRKAVARRR